SLDEPQHEVNQRFVKNIQLTKLPRSCKQAPPNSLSITDLIDKGLSYRPNKKIIGLLHPKSCLCSTLIAK
ncbi:MAG: hypothetical protein ACO3N6_12945, partial [bacterium]